MSNEKIITVFRKKEIIEKIQNKLPYLFQLAEQESSRAGKLGMEVGSVRERVIVALLVSRFGERNVETEIPITEAEVDVKVFGNPISIKTFTGKTFTGVKLIWTVDPKSAIEFSQKYSPVCDMILVQIHWSNGGGLYYIKKETQQKILKEIGREKYIKLPKEGTNPRGVEVSGEALKMLTENADTIKIAIVWKRKDINFNPYKRWVELWEED
jgi:hypothetical protein